jgi:hypothetical protein
LKLHIYCGDNANKEDGRYLKELGAACLAQIAGTPAYTGQPSKGFVTGDGAA